ncbi:MAG TPA: hypothetical protein VKM94_16470 [Blastocatellia bacterium]|nr:hypothetical protein [Blastocatellia bacterium]
MPNSDGLIDPSRVYFDVTRYEPAHDFVNAATRVLKARFLVSRTVVIAKKGFFKWLIGATIAVRFGMLANS